MGVECVGCLLTDLTFLQNSVMRNSIGIYVFCSGVTGYSGTSAWSGISGVSGTSGVSGASGRSGYSGKSGYSGWSGWSGYSGWSGWSGASGYSSAITGWTLGLSLYSTPRYSLYSTITCPAWFTRVRYVGIVDSAPSGVFVIADSAGDMVALYYDGGWTEQGRLSAHSVVGPRFASVDERIIVIGGVGFPFYSSTYTTQIWVRSRLDYMKNATGLWDWQSYLSWFTMWSGGIASTGVGQFPYYRRGVGVSNTGSFFWAYAPSGPNYSAYGSLTYWYVAGDNESLPAGGLLSLWSVFGWQT